MFSLKGKSVFIDNSLFTLGTKVVVFEDEKVLISSTIDPSDNVPKRVAEIVADARVNTVFVKGINKDDSERLSQQIDKCVLQTDFSKTLDKIHYHMI